jgi:hypothetical protein
MARDKRSLKVAVYRALTDRLTDTFIRLCSEYEEAKAFQESRDPFRQSPALPRTIVNSHTIHYNYSPRGSPSDPLTLTTLRTLDYSESPEYDGGLYGSGSCIPSQ